LPWQIPLSATMYLPSSTRLRGAVLPRTFIDQGLQRCAPSARFAQIGAATRQTPPPERKPRKNALFV
jgi:hypothetical protein